MRKEKFKPVFLNEDDGVFEATDNLDIPLFFTTEEARNDMRECMEKAEIISEKS